MSLNLRVTWHYLALHACTVYMTSCILTATPFHPPPEPKSTCPRRVVSSPVNRLLPSRPARFLRPPASQKEPATLVRVVSTLVGLLILYMTVLLPSRRLAVLPLMPRCYFSLLVFPPSDTLTPHNILTSHVPFRCCTVLPLRLWFWSPSWSICPCFPHFPYVLLILPLPC